MTALHAAIAAALDAHEHASGDIGVLADRAALDQHFDDDGLCAHCFVFTPCLTLRTIAVRCGVEVTA